jgi:alcohol dehydrogenase class IV
MGVKPMESFEVPSSARIAYGANRLAGLGKDVRRLAGAVVSVLVVCDPLLAEGGPIGSVLASLEEAGHRIQVFTDVRSDPLDEQVDSAAKRMRTQDVRAVVAVGGGSAMDVGKLAAAIAPGQQSARYYALSRNPFPVGTPICVCVPTTAGTGSEATRVSVFSTPEGAKLWAYGDALRADLALLDPAMTVGLPASLTAATGIDALVHAIEACTNRRAHPLTDAPGLQAIRLVRRHLLRAVSTPDDLEARGAMQIAACLAGQAIDGAGTAIAHGLGHALGAIGKIHHGRAVGLSLRVALAWNAESSPERHAAVARAFGVPGADRDDAVLAADLAPAFDTFLRQVGVRIELGPDGLLPEDAPRLAAEAMKPENEPMRLANCRPVDEQDMTRLAIDLLAAR